MMTALLVLTVLLGGCAVVNLIKPGQTGHRRSVYVLTALNLCFVTGFFWICYLHYSIYRHLPLEISQQTADWINYHLAALNRKSAFAMPLYDTGHIPRYTLPLWIENEKYFFWFMCYALAALVTHIRSRHVRLNAIIALLLVPQSVILVAAADPFSTPLPGFFSEIAPWFKSGMPAAGQIGLFMRLYPRLVFYYNAVYMWLHPPMLFISYACITIMFAACLVMLFDHSPTVERTAYESAKPGFILLTVGMLFGYPWALQAWGPNWWWDPKICSSIIMWAVYGAYLHSRLYLHRSGMWKLTSALGILCFATLILTVLTSYYFPGQHTFQAP